MQLSSVGVKFMSIKVKLHFEAPRAHRLNCLATRRSSTKKGSIKARTFPFKLTTLAAPMFGQRGVQNPGSGPQRPDDATSAVKHRWHSAFAPIGYFRLLAKNEPGAPTVKIFS